MPEVDKERETWPLWDCLSEECQQKLLKAGWKAPHKVSRPPITTEIEDIKEIDLLMKEKPHYEGKVWLGG